MSPVAAFFGAFGFYCVAFLVLGIVLGWIARRRDKKGD